MPDSCAEISASVLVTTEVLLSFWKYCFDHTEPKVAKEKTCDNMGVYI